MFKRLFVIASIVCSPGIAWAQSQCQTINIGSVNQVELRAADGHMNCFELAAATSLQQVTLVSKSVGDFANSIRVLEFDQKNNASVIVENVANSDGAAISSVAGGRRLGFGVWPRSALTMNKHLTVTYFVSEGRGAVVIDISDLPVPPISSGGGGGGGGGGACGPAPKRCLSTPASGQPIDRGALASAARCSASTTIPAGKHPKFDIDKNLAEIESRRALIDTIPNPIDREVVRAAVMVHLFAPDRVYDLKRAGHPYQSSQEFGNYFYGMAAAKIGYSESIALKAGAIVQQYQNFKKQGHPKANDLTAMAAGMLEAARTGKGDNADDPPQISAGYKSGSACSSEKPTPGNTSNGRGAEGILGGLGLGWQGGYLLLAPGCYGDCGGSVSILVGPIRRLP